MTREDLHSRSLGARDRRAHRLRIGVDGEEPRAQFGRLRGRPLDGVGNVVQLEVEKDLFARRSQFGDERQAAAIGELHPNLIEDHAVADPLDEPSRVADVGHVEGDDQSIARRKRLNSPALGGIGALRIEPIGPHKGRRQIAQDRPRANGGITIGADVAGNGRLEAIGELHEHARSPISAKASPISFVRRCGGWLSSGRLETTAAIGWPANPASVRGRS